MHFRVPKGAADCRKIKKLGRQFHAPALPARRRRTSCATNRSPAKPCRNFAMATPRRSLAQALRIGLNRDASFCD
jgi:hypothetical protein